MASSSPKLPSLLPDLDLRPVSSPGWGNMITIPGNLGASSPEPRPGHRFPSVQLFWGWLLPTVRKSNLHPRALTPPLPLRGPVSIQGRQQRRTRSCSEAQTRWTGRPHQLSQPGPATSSMQPPCNPPPQSPSSWAPDLTPRMSTLARQAAVSIRSLAFQCPSELLEGCVHDTPCAHLPGLGMLSAKDHPAWGLWASPPQGGLNA